MELAEVQKQKKDRQQQYVVTSVEVPRHLHAWLKENKVSYRILMEKAALEIGYDPLKNW